ncbi:MAG TPA: hypothetical protein DCE41_34240 [Cytophagales bacterium]|nr:hypothetical protein [Cytophagales bacterium]HAA24117.1 hypothetical protein [Cytophagales bacterium]HAP62800.1 hypothetical protein [Cytophagales bacterium]
MEKRKIRRSFRDVLWILAGVGSGALGLKGFLMPSHFFDGGATGIALMVSAASDAGIGYMVLLVNLPFILLGYFQMSRRFLFRTVISVTTLSMVVTFVDFPTVTTDPVLAAIFGGFFLGAGIGLSIRGGGVIDGTEIVALYVSRHAGVSVGDVIIGINLIIFGVAAWGFGIEVALYSLLAYLVASKTVDFIIQGIEEYLQVTIISRNPGAIQERVIQEMGMGITILKGQGGYGTQGPAGTDKDVLFTVITRLEWLKIKRIIDEEDPKGFVIIQGVRDVMGGMLRKRRIPG